MKKTEIKEVLDNVILESKDFPDALPVLEGNYSIILNLLYQTFSGDSYTKVHVEMAIIFFVLGRIK
jgi:hypothetical protein